MYYAGMSIAVGGAAVFIAPLAAQFTLLTSAEIAASSLFTSVYAYGGYLVKKSASEGHMEAE